MRPQVNLKFAVIVVPLLVAVFGFLVREYFQPWFIHQDYHERFSPGRGLDYSVIKRREWTGRAEIWHVVVRPVPHVGTTSTMGISGSDMGNHSSGVDVAKDKIYVNGQVLPSAARPYLVLIGNDDVLRGNDDAKKWKIVELDLAEREQLTATPPENWPSLSFWKEKVESWFGPSESMGAAKKADALLSH